MKFRVVHLGAGLAALLVLAGLAPARAADQASTPKELDGFDAFIAGVLKQWDAPGAAIAIVQDGHVVLSKGYGVRDAETGAAMTSDTLFPIQSDTKAFTAFTVGLLVDEGRMSLDAPVSTYIPDFRLENPLASQQVTLRDFLSHRSGLAGYSWLWIANKELTRRDAVGRIAYLPTATPIRTKWSYANMGYVAAAQAVENVAGEPWERFTEERVLQPLGMARTTLSAEKANADANHISGSMWLHGKKIVTPMQGTTPATYSTGGIYSTADDMTKWIRLQLGDGTVDGKRIIQSATLAETHAPQMITNRPLPKPEFTSAAYGLGWFVESYRGETLVEHGGNHWGVGSSVGLLPDRNLGVVVFVNQDGDLPTYLMLSILDRYMGKGRRDWTGEMAADQNSYIADEIAREKDRDKGRVTNAAAGHPLADYAGSYEHPGFGAITIAVEGKTLTARYGGDASALELWNHDTFAPTAMGFGNAWSMFDNVRVQFLSGFDGKVDGLRISPTPDGVIFKRAPETKSAK